MNEAHISKQVAETMLTNLRRIGGYITASLSTIFALSLFYFVYQGQVGAMQYTLLSFLCMASTWAFVLITPHAQVTRYICAVSGIVQISLIVAISSGQKMQLDFHMYYFAWLAVLVLLVDWRAILMAAVVTAVHHMGFNFLLPQLVFPDGASFARVVLHAVAVVIQTAALLWFTYTLEHMLKGLGAFSQTFARAATDLDLTATLQADSRTEVGKLGQAANQLLGRLLEAMQEVKRTSLSLESAATQLEQSGEGISRRSQAQVATTNQIHQQITESSRQISEVSSIARQADEQSVSLTSNADHISEVMQRLQHNSEEIGQISMMISTFSEQTNLLALNASIEAARAGDAGRGFAVVANEVRTLSQNVSQSAIDISAKVKTLRDNIGEAISGVTIIGEAVGILGAINKQVNNTVQNQASATHEISNLIQNFQSQLAAVVAELEVNTSSIATVAAESQKLSVQTAVFKL